MLMFLSDKTSNHTVLADNVVFDKCLVLMDKSLGYHFFRLDNCHKQPLL